MKYANKELKKQKQEENKTNRNLQQKWVLQDKKEAFTRVQESLVMKSGDSFLYRLKC